MGKSAKLTRGGNKKRVNVGRQEAKLREQGGASHRAATRAKTAVAKMNAVDAKSKATKESVTAYAKKQGASNVRMAPKPKKAS